MNKSVHNTTPSELSRYQDALKTGLLHAQAGDHFDRFVRFLAQAVDTACAIMFISDLTRHHFVACEGLSLDSVPRDGSVLTRLLFSQPKQISSASKLNDDKYWQGFDPASGALGMQSMLGIPLLGPEGHIIGGLVLMDTKPHVFNGSDEQILHSITELVQGELSSRCEQMSSPPTNQRVNDPECCSEVFEHGDVIQAELERARLNKQKTILIEAELVPVTYAKLEQDALDFLQKERIAAIKRTTECTVSSKQNSTGRFTILIHEPDCDVSIALQRIKTAANGVSSYKMKPIASKVYFGVAVYPDNGNRMHDLIEAAETVLESAKKPWNQDVQFASAETQKNFTRLHLMEAQLSKAIPGVDLQTIFQPIIDVNSGQLLGVDASCQWRTENYGLVPAKDFLPMAANSGQLQKIADCVLESAIRQGAVWQNMSGRALMISVAIAPEMLTIPDMAERVHQQMQGESLSEGSLLLVVTLNSLKDLCPTTAQSIHHFQNLGIQVAVNHNDTEYSALSQLKSLTVSAVKLQRHFLESITIGEPAQSITKVVVDTAKNLGLDIIIEDVQNEAEFRALRALGCRAVQGDYISPAVSGDEISCVVSEGTPLLGNIA